MTTTELLDRAAALLSDPSKRVLLVATDARAREVLRKGLSRRVDRAALERAHFAAPGRHDHSGLRIDEVLVDPSFEAVAKLAEREWLDGVRKNALSGSPGTRNSADTNQIL